MNWIPYVSMAGRAKEDLPGGSLKFLLEINRPEHQPRHVLTGQNPHVCWLNFYHFVGWVLHRSCACWVCRPHDHTMIYSLIYPP